VTQKGQAMIGDLRTDALHEALEKAEIDDMTFVALLVLALGGDNVSVQSGSEGFERKEIGKALIQGGVLTSDGVAIHTAARTVLKAVLSCRINTSNSGPFARVAGDAIGASLHLPNMASEEFLSCLSKAGLEKAARAEGVRVESRGRDTRANMVERFKDGRYVYPVALFRLTEEEAREAERPREIPGWSETEDGDAEAVEDSADGEPKEPASDSDSFPAAAD
jgi:ParB family chromosome partitioning protein